MMADDGRAAIAAMRSFALAASKLARVPARAAREASADIRRLIFEQFAAQTDPYGNAWEEHAEATVDRWGEHPILALSRVMLNGVDVRPMAGSGIAVTLGAPEYAAFHQTGTKHMPARPILPYAGLPSPWSRALTEASNNAFSSTMGAR